MGFEIHSDYGSGSSMNLSTSWGSQDHFTTATTAEIPTKTHSFSELVAGRCSIEEAMQEFRRNGHDSPYDPDEDHLMWTRKRNRQYLHQKSWPAPESSPAVPLPAAAARPAPSALSPLAPSWTPFGNQPSPPPDTQVADFDPPAVQADNMTATQLLQILGRFPADIVYNLLRALDGTRGCEPSAERHKKRKPEFCRFCKSNGERELYYLSHTLRDARGIVRCPVLRAYVCARCGARGDYAHTAKYCPFATAEDRKTSANMMLSIRQKAGRYRHRYSTQPSTGGNQYAESSITYLQDDYTNAIYNSASETPLDPQWAALAQKLSL